MKSHGTATWAATAKFIRRSLAALGWRAETIAVLRPGNGRGGSQTPWPVVLVEGVGPWLRAELGEHLSTLLGRHVVVYDPATWAELTKGDPE
jgi:hypothetical protein